MKVRMELVYVYSLFMSACFMPLVFTRPELIEGDILQNKRIVKKRARRNIKENNNEKYLWENAIVAYTFGSYLGKYTRKSIVKSMHYIEKYTCVEFRERTSEEDYIKFVSGEGCYSYVGKQGGEQILSIGVGCSFKANIVHEILHALGMYHEQSRYDRDLYINVLWWNIQKGAEKNFEPRFHDQGINAMNYQYDYNSVTHYKNREFSKNGKSTLQVFEKPSMKLGNTKGMSKMDIKKINEAYKCKQKRLKVSCKDKFSWCENYKRHCNVEWFAKKYCQKTCDLCLT